MPPLDKEQTDWIFFITRIHWWYSCWSSQIWPGNTFSLLKDCYWDSRPERTQWPWPQIDLLRRPWSTLGAGEGQAAWEVYHEGSDLSSNKKGPWFQGLRSRNLWEPEESSPSNLASALWFGGGSFHVEGEGIIQTRSLVWNSSRTNANTKWAACKPHIVSFRQKIMMH